MGWVTFHATGERLGDGCRSCGGTGTISEDVGYSDRTMGALPCPDCASGGMFQRALDDAAAAVSACNALFGPPRR